MRKRARRLAIRMWHAPARRACLALCLLIGAQAPLQGAAQQTPDIIDARYSAPTDRYPHGVLGDPLEWGALTLTLDDCPGCARMSLRDVTIHLPETRVFEDLSPRIVDLDHDGLQEVITVESDASKGARLAVYGPTGLITATPFIGTRFRWLAPLGAADLDGDGSVELAYIDRPHLAKTLRVWRYENQNLTEIATLLGLTNHRIGQDFISGGIRTCGTSPEIITADANWQNVMATILSNGQLTTRKLSSFTGPAALTEALACQ